MAIHSCKNQETYFEPNFANTAHETFYSMTVPFGTEACFSQLTKGKQREYADYITDAKREETRIKRLEKILPLIKTGKGLYDKYRNG
jgi:hypothetical protein